ncbi:hypothetical protein Avbf_17966 [Armadillidium vulgare]|nr:hypothetical protein Avbf_17966 [Armadillidium vulgare]
MEFIMDIKTEVEIKDEIVDSLEDVKNCNQYFGQELELEQIQMTQADDDISNNRSIKEIDETELLSENDHDKEEDESSFEEEEEFEGFIHSDNFKERSNLLKQMILQLRNLQSDPSNLVINDNILIGSKTSVTPDINLLSPIISLPLDTSEKVSLLLSFYLLLQNFARVYIHPSFKNFIEQLKCKLCYKESHHIDIPELEWGDSFLMMKTNDLSPKPNSVH